MTFASEWLVRVYLNEHYRDATLSNQYLAAHFHVTARTLRNHFKREYGTTPHQYYSRLRVTHGLALMQQYHYTTRQVYDKIGYGDESSFRYALKQFRKNKAQ
ncbi:helix-turn-helix domain-containing protein [Sinomicrobium soli]|uniref:helix-turn-helix domain-containing protein n=1 Tax=Sinomicrobium sp. N-1-3-6 TaxID=2219864 RepID=UPI0013751E9B|nr:helix-turn-helix domain-containing protein [Sinomicrobium sp. N-1-3-6]